MFSLQLSLVSVADNSHFCLFHINPYAKHKIQTRNKFYTAMKTDTMQNDGTKALVQSNSIQNPKLVQREQRRPATFL